MPWLESAVDLARARAEQPFVFEAASGRLTGIYCPADPAAAPAGRCILMLTRPRSHRNRMWVECARRMSAKGFSSFRFDYHGDGDSEGESSFHNPNTPYREDAVSALRAVREQFGDTRFLVLGACFDARTIHYLAAFVRDICHKLRNVAGAQPCWALGARRRSRAKSRMATSAGLIPARRPACPRVAGRKRVSTWRASLRRPGRVV